MSLQPGRKGCIALLRCKGDRLLLHFDCLSEFSAFRICRREGVENSRVFPATQLSCALSQLQRLFAIADRGVRASGKQARGKIEREESIWLFRHGRIQLTERFREPALRIQRVTKILMSLGEIGSKPNHIFPRIDGIIHRSEEHTSELQSL